MWTDVKYLLNKYYVVYYVFKSAKCKKKRESSQVHSTVFIMFMYVSEYYGSLFNIGILHIIVLQLGMIVVSDSL